MKSNKELKKVYNRVFSEGEEQFFTKYKDGIDQSDNDVMVINKIGEIDKLSVLDVGCGTGKLAHTLSQLGNPDVVGIDYSEKAIEIANKKYQSKNLRFKCLDINDWQEPIDVIVSCGTFEHMDNPEKTLKKMSSFLNENGSIILTCPHFYNIRGIIWITLQKLLDVPMSLTDLHSISPSDMERWANSSGLKIVDISMFDDDKANGPGMIIDLKKRLTNALKDANLENGKVNNLLSWLEDLLFYKKNTQNKLSFEGVNAIYTFKKMELK